MTTTPEESGGGRGLPDDPERDPTAFPLVDDEPEETENPD
jgi:hypothetical protein